MKGKPLIVSTIPKGTTQRPSQGAAELNNEMLRDRYAVNNAGSSARGLKFSEICGEKRAGI